jgi:G3E family GTPase
MSKTGLILITGFLGAGKTTFLKGFLMRFQGMRLHVIVNEFGKAGVDGALLSALGVTKDEISNGSIFCACRQDCFEEALGEALAKEPDMILTEASGLSDPTAIRKILDRYPGITYMGCIALADAVHVHKVLETARMVEKQFALSNVILLNKTDLVDQERAEVLQGLLEARFPDAKVHHTQQGVFRDEWLNELKGAAKTGGQEKGHIKDITLQKACITVSNAMASHQLRHFIALFAGDTWRVKGIVTLCDGSFHADCIGSLVQLQPYAGPPPSDGNQLTALAGAGMQLQKSIQKAREWYPELVTKVE